MKEKYSLYRYLQKTKIPYSRNLLRELALQNFTHYEGLKKIFKDDPSLAEDYLNKKNEIQVWQAEYIRLFEQGIRSIMYGDIDYPSGFYFMEDPPLVLNIIGHSPWMKFPCLSVVGSRDFHPFTVQWINTQLNEFSIENKICWVSGGARGIDQEIHRFSIYAEQPTVVILPSGIEEIYPSQLKELKDKIIFYGGCIISEYSPEQKINKYLFHHRNRLISAMGAATLILEAKLKSGTLMTAGIAAEQGRPVFVIPGHPLENSYQGNLELLHQGATMVRNAQDLEDLFRCEIKNLNHEFLGVGF